jgi:endonuclease/exonuclease/phosphatase family metal-dependent hydrolase
MRALRLRIASFNLENLSADPSAAAGPAERHTILRPQLQRLKADILCLQEVDGWRGRGDESRTLATLDALLKETEYAGFHRAHSRSAKSEEPRDRQNLVILSRWPIVATAQYMNDFVPPPHYSYVTAAPPLTGAPIVWDRPILEARIALPHDRILTVINMHLKAPLASFVPGQKSGAFTWKTVGGWAEGYFLATMKRTGQALEARLLAERIFDADPGALLAVCGDFNAEERDAAFRILAGDTEDTGNGRLTERELIALEHTLPDHRRFTVIHAGQKRMLDHILVSRSLLRHFRALEVHNEALGDEVIASTMVESSPESYHAPVLAIFDVAERLGLASPGTVRN